MGFSWISILVAFSPWIHAVTNITRINGIKAGPSFRFRYNMAANNKEVPALRREGKTHTFMLIL
jgi:hypothetical protein